MFHKRVHKTKERERGGEREREREREGERERREREERERERDREREREMVYWCIRVNRIFVFVVCSERNSGCSDRLYSLLLYAKRPRSFSLTGASAGKASALRFC